MSMRTFHVRSELPLEKAAIGVFAALDLDVFEERDSSSYPGGTYFMAEDAGLVVKVARESEAEWDDFQYWVTFSLDDEDEDPAESAADFAKACDGLVRRLLRAGFGVGRETGWTDTDVTRELYALDASGALRRSEETRPIVL